MAKDVNPAAITIEDCLDMYEKKQMTAAINDGQVTDFITGGAGHANGN